MRLWLSLAAVVALAPIRSDACDCARRTDAEALQELSVVVEGTVSITPGETGRASIVVSKSLKGAKPGDTLAFEWFPRRKGGCPGVEVKPGPWRLYLLKTAQGLSLTTCDFNSRPL